MKTLLVDSLSNYLALLLLTAVPVVFAVILYWLEKTTSEVHSRTFGWRGVLISTAWIGTPVHEISHTVFALLFRFHIQELKLFHPDKQTGTLGYITFSYNPHNPIQLFGKFPVGVAPLLFGSVVLCGLVYFLPTRGDILLISLWSTNSSLNVSSGFVPQMIQSFAVMYDSAWHLIILLDYYDWRTYLFLYLSMCVSSHMAPSSSDFNGAWIGLFILLGFTLVLVILASAMQISLGVILDKAFLAMNTLLALLLIAVLLSAVNLLLSTVVMLIKTGLSR